MSELKDGRVSRKLDEWVEVWMNELNGGRVTWNVDDWVEWWMSELIDGWVSWLVDEWVELWTSDLKCGWVSWLVAEWVDLWLSELISGWVSGLVAEWVDWWLSVLKAGWVSQSVDNVVFGLALWVARLHRLNALTYFSVLIIVTSAAVLSFNMTDLLLPTLTVIPSKWLLELLSCYGCYHYCLWLLLQLLSLL